jgi:hypothetical protein
VKPIKLNLALFLQLCLLAIVVASVTQAQTRQTARSEPGDLYLVVKNGRFGYIDRNGRLAIQPQYEWAFPFSEGLALIVTKGKKERSAYINKAGTLVIKPFEGSPSNFSSGVARVLLGGSYVYIDKKGRWATTRSYQSAEDCTEGLCAVKMETPGPNMWGYINPSGAVVVKAQYDWAHPFREGIARVAIMIGEPYEKNGAPAVDLKVGYIDGTGKPITPLAFDKAWDFSNGMAQVQLKGKWGYIDKTGRLVISCQYDETHPFQEDLAGVKVNGLWGFIDKNGKIAIPAEFEFVNDFSEGLAAVGRRGQNFYIDRNGKVILSPLFKGLGPFRAGLATFRVDDKTGVLNKAGKVVLDAQFASIEILSEGVIAVEDPKEGIGYADRTGRFFWPLTGSPPSITKKCEYKLIAVPTDNGSNQELGQLYDLKRLASVMRLNRDYEVNDHYNGDGVVVSRMFKGVKYNIVFENRNGFSEFNLDTDNFKGYPNGTIAWGEKCSTPNHLVKRNVYRMIDDLPFSSQQKSELKQYVRVTSMASGSLF